MKKEDARTLGWLAVILLVTTVLYWPSLQGAFVVDDVNLIEHNPYLGSFRHFGRFFTQGFGLNSAQNDAAIYLYRPLLLVSWSLEKMLAGGGPTGFHVLSLLVYLACILLVYRLIRELTPAAPAAALLGTALFALHPIHVEAVAWIAALNDPLAALFIMAALLAHRRHAASASPAWLALSAVSFAGGLLTKEVALVFPLVALAHDRLYYRRIVWRSFAVQCLVAVSYLLVRHAALGPPQGQELGFGMLEFQRALTYLSGYIEAFLSWEQPFYVTSPAGTVGGMKGYLILAGAFLGGGLALKALPKEDRPALIFSFIWCLAFFWPALVLPFHKASVFGIRILFVPSIGLAALASMVLHHMVKRAMKWRLLILSATLALAAGLVFGTRAEILAWRDEASLFAKMTRTPSSQASGYLHLGMVALEREDYLAAEEWLQKSLENTPDPEMRSRALIHLGEAAAGSNRLDKAESYLQEATMLSLGNGDAWNGLGNVAWMRGNLMDAKFYYEKACRVAPGNFSATNNLAMVYEQLGQREIARQLRLKAESMPRGRTKTGSP